ncbi:Uncharacterised protein [Vibrio cholerae]|nr:Uncharacterised protein [Vibrio cholerae]
MFSVREARNSPKITPFSFSTSSASNAKPSAISANHNSALSIFCALGRSS